MDSSANNRLLGIAVINGSNPVGTSDDTKLVAWGLTNFGVGF